MPTTLAGTESAPLTRPAARAVSANAGDQVWTGEPRSRHNEQHRAALLPMPWTSALACKVTSRESRDTTHRSSRSRSRLLARSCSHSSDPYSCVAHDDRLGLDHGPSHQLDAGGTTPPTSWTLARSSRAEPIARSSTRATACAGADALDCALGSALRPRRRWRAGTRQATVRRTRPDRSASRAAGQRHLESGTHRSGASFPWARPTTRVSAR
jgi:hypothetical protein